MDKDKITVVGDKTTDQIMDKDKITVVGDKTMDQIMDKDKITVVGGKITYKDNNMEVTGNQIMDKVEVIGDKIHIINDFKHKYMKIIISRT